MVEGTLLSWQQKILVDEGGTRGVTCSTKLGKGTRKGQMIQYISNSLVEHHYQHYYHNSNVCLCELDYVHGHTQHQHLL